MWDWTFPAVFFDIRPKCLSRERALEVYCSHYAKSKHECIRAHEAFAKATA
jgi:hypothetical protein